MRCTRCKSTNFQREEISGNPYCIDCGEFQEYENYEANLGSIRGPEGTYVRIGTIGTGSVLAYKEKKIYEAKNLIESITERLNLGYKNEEIKSMISEITDGEFGQGEWFSILVGACCYALVRKEGKCVLPIEEISVSIGCDLHQLGSMVKRVVDHLGLEFQEFDLVGLFSKTASNSSRLSCVDEVKKERVMKQGVFLMNCCLKWFLSTGRRPMPLVVAVLAFVGQVNGVKVKIEELAKDMRVSLSTCKMRYRELLVKLVKVAEEVGLPWWRDVNVKNVVKHSGTLLGLMEAKSMRKRIKGKEDGEFGRTDVFCFKDIVRDCLNKETMYCYDDDSQDSMSRYFDVGRESHQLSLCTNQLPTMCNEFDDGVHGRVLEKRSQGGNKSMWERRSVFAMVSSDSWWKGKSKLSQKLLLKEVLEKDVGLDALPPSYIAGCNAVKRRKEKIKAAKLRINAIQHPSRVVVSETEVSSEVEHSKKKRKIGSEIDWEDLIIQTLVLNNVNDEEIEKGHYKALLGLHVFNS
ncbi:hypothetical protein AALP_AA7G229900 [Arabis alpina]|uniref:BRF2-like C-terminal domain-containing protein n=1 Tax=Arabis alpina TaxID=50452 RepID=A0A087GJY9_ARAAL|nr:hypothetical protein AALP_AA7G229900 [Arabis alpina]